MKKAWRWPHKTHSKFMKHALLLDEGPMSEDIEFVLAHGDNETEVIALLGSIRAMGWEIRP